MMMLMMMMMMMMMEDDDDDVDNDDGNLYITTVPLVGRDVQDTELVKDMLAQLHHLDNIVNTVFSNITTRIAAEKTRLSTLNRKCQTCRGLITSLQGSTKAMTVFSTAKYPAPTKLPYPYTLHPTGLLTTEDLPSVSAIVI